MKKSKHYKRAESIVNMLRFKPNKDVKLNKTQQFFIEAFKKDLSDEDFKGVKKAIKLYFADKLSNSLKTKIEG